MNSPHPEEKKFKFDSSIQAESETLPPKRIFNPRPRREVELDKSDLKKQISKRERPQALTLQFDEDITRKQVRDIPRLWSPYWNILELNMAFKGSKKKANEEFCMLCINLPKLISLRSLALDFTRGKIVLYKRAKDLSKSLKRIPTLESLSISLDEWNPISQKLLQSLRKGLKYLASLHHLNLKITYDQLCKDSVEQLSKFLIGLKSLRTVTLDFYLCIVDFEAFYGFVQKLNQRTCLKQLNLEFQHCQDSTNLGFKSLYQHLGSLGSFNILVTNDKRDQLLSTSLEKVPNLRSSTSRISKSSDQKESSKEIPIGSLKLHFDIDGQSFKQNELSFWELGDSLKEFAKLKNLRLNFEFSGLSHHSLLPKINPENPNYVERSIYFESLLHDQAERNKDFKLFNLNFSHCPKILDQDLIILGKQVQKIDLLETVNLDFSSCYFLGFEPFELLLEGLSKLVFLKNLRVDFSKKSTSSQGYWKDLQMILKGKLRIINDCSERIKRFCESVPLAEKNPTLLEYLLWLREGARQVREARNHIKNKRYKIRSMIQYFKILDEMIIELRRSLLAYDLNIPIQPSHSFGNYQESKDSLRVSENELRVSKYYSTSSHDPSKLEQILINIKNFNSQEETSETPKVGFPSLQILSIGIGGLADFDDKNFEFINEIIKKSTYLQDLSLDLSSLDELTSKGLEDLLEGLHSLENLQKLNLNLSKYFFI